ncbi:peptidoglycan-binding protein [Salipaludibacillus agaradhaerens]|uniref:Peptidoglycan-binding protein n=1 Tax=Salipaludibacillus agaradhaerens TaxID=76935 RepID=A0A9Q4AYL4_SALAG|nr:peptidoglycan-binding protein [Salipaludibacillus agaradhaerens]MCR6094940.1 peptidoglycan-binding protein [Salipaludibacillus agaradhaerens]MCR6115502.1 peptidoglycan-binding protein [Salipaludibacillus agaradhaerens]
MKKEVNRFFIAFICVLLVFPSFIPLMDSKVSAADETYEYSDDELTTENFEEVLKDPLVIGDESEYVEILRQLLFLAGFTEEVQSDNFDENLLNSIKDFQNFIGLEITGDYTLETHESLELYLFEVKDIKYKFGDNSSGVIQLKKDLTSVGYGNFPTGPSPYYGSLTSGAVKLFQEEQGLIATGAVDGETEQALATLSKEIDSQEKQQTEDFGETGANSNESESIETEPSQNEIENEDVDSHSADLDSSKNENESTFAIAQEEADELSLPYKDGDKGIEIVTLKEKLTQLGFGNFPSNPSENYGPVTMSVVEEFQAYFGLETTGITNQATLDKLEEELNTIYRDGNSHDDIVSLKQNLTLLGYGNFPENPSRNYGPVTASIVMEFQKANGLRINGMGDSVTLALIEELIEDSYEPNTLTLPYNNGDKGPEIVTLKENLTQLDFGNFPSNPSENYGPVTMSVVEEFQAYFGLEVTGITNQATLNKLEDELNTIYRDGNSHDDIVALKQNLTLLGYGNFPENPSRNYGPVTASVVIEFQKAEGLKVNGIGDSVTFALIEELIGDSYEPNTLTLPYNNGDKGPEIVTLKENLTQLGFGNFPSNPSENYGPVTMSVVEEFQVYFGLEATGITNQATLNKLEDELNTIYRDGNSHNDIVTLKQNLTLLGYGNFPENPSRNYGSVTASIVMEFQKAVGLKVNGIADSVTLIKLEEKIQEFKNPALSLPFENGDRGELIIELKKDLTKLGFGNFPENPSAVYGSVTMRVVEEFQSYYGLNVTGVTNEITFNRLQTELNSIYRNGQSHPDIVSLKQNLTFLGYGNFPNNPSQNYGSVTETVVKEFQKAEGLVENGYGDSVTIARLEQRVAEKPVLPYEIGDKGEEIVKLKQDLSKLGFGNFPANPSSTYGSVTESVVREFQVYYGLPNTGKVDQAMLDYMVSIFNSPYSIGKSSNAVRELKINLTTLGFGSFPRNPSRNYGSVTATVVREFQRHHKLAVNGIADEVTLAKIAEELERQTRFYNMTVQQMVDRQMTFNPQTDLYGLGWQSARRADVEFYVNPANFTLDPSHRDMYQFLKLNQTSGVSSTQLNLILHNKGILHNTGGSFKSAAETYGVNDIYLISHALLETGHGRSDLSNGSILVGQISSNKWVSVQGSRKYILERVNNQWINTRNDNFNTSGITLRKTYNMFGIDAVDSDPYTRGSVHAFRAGWFTPAAAINGGAQFISSNYLARGQDTLYKMRWDPDFHEAALNSHISINRSSQFQYATDIGWAYKQTSFIKQLYDQIDNANLQFEIPVYR